MRKPRSTLPPLRGLPLVILVLLAAITPFRARAASPHDGDPSERGSLQTPPTPSADYVNMKLEVQILDMAVPKASMRQTLTIKAWDAPVSRLDLDAKGLAIQSVESFGRKITYDIRGPKLIISFSPPVPPGETADVVTAYTIDDPPLGLIWTLPTPASPGVPARPGQIHTQGESDDSSYWFPCHDYPNEKLTTELVVTAPADYQVSSNGKLLSRERRVLQVPAVGGRSDIRPFEVWHWRQDKPHVNYLVSLVVGQFDVVDVGTKDLSMPVYVPVGRGKDVPACFGRTPEMVAAFAKAFDEPYPWDRYAQVVVRDFAAGGMENTSCTTLLESAIVGEADRDDHTIEGLISHELAHQWFGDLLTCRTWGDIWLNEGFATYAEAIWAEARVGAPGDPKDWSGQPGYEREIIGCFESMVNDDRGTVAGGDVGMASEVYRHADDVFDRKANPYPKGAAILHMLRRKLGDAAFFSGLRSYVELHKFGLVSTEDFQRSMEEAGGTDLKGFFDQWARRPGIPRIKAKVEWLEGEKGVKVSLEQTQTIGHEDPAFAFEVPFLMRDARGTLTKSRFEMKGAKAAAMVRLEQAPVMVAIDPEMAVLAEWTIEAPVPWLIEQLRGGPTLASRVQAARTLASDAWDESAEALRRVALDTGEMVTLRVQAVKSLGKRLAWEDIESLSTSARDRWEVREAVTNALIDLALAENVKEKDRVRAHALEVLTNRAQRDESLKVRCASIRALGKLKDPSSERLLLSFLSKDSHGDALRQAALEAAADYGLASAMDLAQGIARDSLNHRTRSRALRTIATLGKTDKGPALEGLCRGLSDRHATVRMAAADAVVDLADERGIALLEQAIKRERALTQQENFLLKLRDLEKKVRGDAGTPAAATDAESK